MSTKAIYLADMADVSDEDPSSDEGSDGSLNSSFIDDTSTSTPVKRTPPPNPYLLGAPAKGRRTAFDDYLQQLEVSIVPIIV